MRGHGVVGTGQASDTVQQNDHVALVFHQTPGLFNDHLRDLDVARGRLIERGTDHLALDRAQHIRDFLGALVDQQDDEDNFGMIPGDAVGDPLQDHGLAGEWGCHDEAALTSADGREQIQNPRGHVTGIAFQRKAFGRVQGGQVFEDGLVFGDVRVLEVDGFDPQQRKVLLIVLGRPDLP